MSEIYQTIIIGAGPAGLSAALYIGRGGLKSLVLTGPALGGQATQTTHIDNYPGSPINFTGSALAENLRQQVESFEVPLISDKVLEVRKNEATNLFEVITAQMTYLAQTIIITTGATRRRLGLVGENELIGRGLSFCATCDGPFFRDKEIAVVGGGSTALEEAIFLTNFASRVHLIHRRDQFRTDDSGQVQRLHAHPQIEIHFNTQVEKYLTDQKGRLTGLTLVSADKNYDLPVAGVFLAIGTDPNSELFKSLGVDMDQSGYIKVSSDNDSFKTATNIPGVFAAGDVTDPLYKQLIIAAGMGAQAALDVQHYLTKA